MSAKSGKQEAQAIFSRMVPNPEQVRGDFAMGFRLRS